MEGVRVRLVFENGHILSKSQRSEGLKRSWLLIKPQRFQTVSDISSYLLHIFNLHHSCPNGLLLSMDGFVLPPFESTCILKDRDIISVRKKGGSSSDINQVGDAANSVEGIEIVEKQPLHTGFPLLTNEEFEKETGGYQSEQEEDEEDQLEETLPVENSSGGNAVSKKRKASKKLSGSKKKKHRSVVQEGIVTNIHTEQIESRHNDGVHPCKNLHKQKVPVVKSKPNTNSTLEIAETSNDDADSSPCVKRDQLQDNGEGVKDVPTVPEETKKIPSRSARRKKSKRKWLREIAKAEKEAEKEDGVCHSKGILHLHQKQERAKAKAEKEVDNEPKGLLHWKLPEKDVIETNQNSDVEDDVVPIVIRPGHIRFEPLEEEEAVHQSRVSVSTFQWNGISSKKKGQKWGTEKLKFSSARMNDYNDLDNELSETLPIGNERPANDPIDFDKLPVLTISPKEGDTIAYRLLELSSSWTPELSSFRVGRISWYDPESSTIMLMPVPEYPIISEKVDEDDDTPQPDSLYDKDGNLEIEFSSLVDVRIVKQSDSAPSKTAVDTVNKDPPVKKDAILSLVPSNKQSDSDPAKTVTIRVNKDLPVNKDAISSLVPSNHDKQKQAPTQENGEVNLWEHFSEALNAKKAQLADENDLNKGSSGKSSWSYKALRSSALGPTMALLRSKNNI